MIKITDVARHAGVSPSTVSYVLSGKRSISEQTARRVEESIRVLGYRPHAGARSLAGSRAKVFALVIPLRSGVHVPVMMRFVAAVATAARRHDHDVLLLTQEEGAEGLRRVARSALADAFVLMDVQLHDERLPVLRELDRPAVLIGLPARDYGFTCVDLDFAAAGERCVRHLAGLGHREIVLIGSPPEVYARETGFAARVRDGLQRAAGRLGVRTTVCPCAADPEAARVLARAVLRERPEATSLVVHNEFVLDSLLAELGRAGVLVPRDLSVLALCPDEQAERAAVPLTSVAIPAEELGERAVQLLVAKLEGHEPPRTALLPPRLTERASTAPPRA
ncbi:MULTISPECIES: LacI family DNA-binding transcriptional regulator [unclassified Crossiella]|uniref:LacI family DNA-binding transcriptional regulator n=1 Tax=unclassified Crossiella TaxID=2620835 RepID=UPI001FFF9CEA|nr:MULTISPECIES: LacI family DNA-binding transcriptional regulator [unclassified Crossiella]MCK2244977.1 LacI family transcriptional regulator [Crossiella sp. S99.2]MCK2258702.1 LacI family transcriptional regulator [Crossiella sp. S99.1]